MNLESCYVMIFVIFFVDQGCCIDSDENNMKVWNPQIYARFTRIEINGSPSKSFCIGYKKRIRICHGREPPPKWEIFVDEKYNAMIRLKGTSQYIAPSSSRRMHMLYLKPGPRTVDFSKTKFVFRHFIDPLKRYQTLEHAYYAGLHVSLSKHLRYGLWLNKREFAVDISFPYM